METIKVPFQGIARNTENGAATDGECQELINARLKNGAIVPVSQPINIGSHQYLKKIYWHENANMYIAITSSDTVMYGEDIDGYSGMMSTDVQGVQSIDIVGNVVCLNTENQVYYVLYSKSKGYTYLGVIPELPYIGIATEQKLFADVIGWNSTYVGTVNNLTQTEDEYYGMYQKLLSKANENGYFFKGCSLRMAFKLFDGSYIKHSQIIHVSQDVDTTLSENIEIEGDVGTVSFDIKSSLTLAHFSSSKSPTMVEEFGGSAGDTVVNNSIIGLLQGFRFNFAYSTVGLNLWKDIITSIDIFATPSFDEYIGAFYSEDGDSYPLDFSEYEDIDKMFEAHEEDFEEAVPEYSTPDLETEIIEKSSFYKIASISLTSGEIDYPEDDVSKDVLVLNDELTDDTAQSHLTTAPLTTYLYNSKLHYGGIKQYYGDGYDLRLGMIDSSYGVSCQINAYVEIEAANGDFVVKKEHIGIYNGKLNGFFMYPDSNATRLILEYNDKTVSYDLTSHPYLNLSYVLLMDSELGYLQRIKEIDITDEDLYDSEESLTVSNDGFTTGTTLKVSSLSNPFYFPASTVYSFQNNIIGMQSNTTALSEGQFGQYPLYVFTGGGINAMSVGTDGVTYSTSLPVSRDVAINDSIIGTDSSVVFITQKGVFAISGSGVQNLSEKLDGFLSTNIENSTSMQTMLSYSGLPKSSVLFSTYIENAILGYIYNNSEIVVSNSDYDYSYVYNILSGMWHKVDSSFYGFVNRYPETYVMALEDGYTEIYDLYNPSISTANMLVLTRPMKLGVESYKKVLQAAMRGYVKSSGETIALNGVAIALDDTPIGIYGNINFYLFGSSDGYQFKLIGGKENITEYRDLIIRMNRSKSYRYFIVGMYGDARSDLSINYIEFDAAVSFNNRLR